MDFLIIRDSLQSKSALYQVNIIEFSPKMPVSHPRTRPTSEPSPALPAVLRRQFPFVEC